jgi:hypothetical protein
MTKLLTSLALAATITSSQAFIVKVESTFSQAVTDNAGNLISDGSGVVMTGSFLSGLPDFGSSTGQQVADAFTQFGGSGAVGFAGFGGLYEMNATGGRIAPGNPLVGANIFTLVGNGADLASSTQLIAFMHPTLFTVDSNLPVDTNPAATLGEVGGSYAWGGQAFPPVNVGPGGPDLPGVGMGALVPEPSSSLLFGLAGLALIIRRKR